MLVVGPCLLLPAMLVCGSLTSEAAALPETWLVCGVLLGRSLFLAHQLVGWLCWFRRLCGLHELLLFGAMWPKCKAGQCHVLCGVPFWLAQPWFKPWSSRAAGELHCFAASLAGHVAMLMRLYAGLTSHALKKHISRLPKVHSAWQVTCLPVMRQCHTLPCGRCT